MLGRGTALAGNPEQLTLSSDYGLTFTYTANGLKVNTPQDLRAAAGPSFDHVHLTVAIGTAPLTITSTTVCTNLNADLLDGQHATAFEGAGAVSAHAALTTGVHGVGASTIASTGDIATHAALITGVHGLVFTAGKTLTLTESLTLNALPVGGLAVATAANTLGSLAAGLTTQILVGGGAGTVPAWGTDIPTAVTIGTKYIYRADGTDVVVADGGTGISSYAVGDLLYASASGVLSKLADVAAGAYLRSGGVATAPLWSTLLLPNAATAFRLVVATAANTIGELAAVGATGQYLAGATGAIPAWATLNQAAVAGLTTADSPAFVTVKLTSLTDGYIPYHVSDAVGLSNSPIFVNGSSIGIGTVSPQTLLHLHKVNGDTDITLEQDAATRVAALLFLPFGEVSASNVEFYTGLQASANRWMVSAWNGATAIECLSILNTGNVGIAVVAPTSRLEVEDAATTASMLVKITQDDENVYGLVIGNDTYSTTDTNGLLFKVADTGAPTISWTAGVLTLSGTHVSIGAGSLVLPASQYVNFGGTQGSGGYGLRDNSGAVEYKDSGGAWKAFSSPGYVDRGDTSGWDFTQSSGITTDGDWHTLDLSSIVPAGAKAVHLRVFVLDDVSGSDFYVRKLGYVGTDSAMFCVFTQAASTYYSADGIVACDSNRCVQYKAANTTWTVLLGVVGWFI